ncbi:tetratricopeptide repeat protein [Actinomadura soli]|uniref:Tetratricopeptide repeat protein n=1 Tax=Actinomadura soli TaxID=2508997 RepID=A0A5C4JGH3_9ACTN|nr:LuxR C-terminal-related transcriptional regulator [Actinomadura soli]TMR04926.1 tetratricopeptide repeat protein [Actinomadura soli]
MSVRATPRYRGDLPVEVTSFVGRRRELSEARRLLGRTRLLTFVGAGGVGKTRLARRVAADLRRAFPDGVWLVDLAPLQDEELLAPTVAATLGLADWSVQPSLDSLVDFVSDKHLLIVLDNCEHLLDVCAALADGLLSAAANVRILVTSRQPLGVGGETVLDVPPMSLPAPDRPMSERHLDESEAVRLFMERAAEAVPDLALAEGDWEAVARLCRRLDGIPLAIELAAVRLRSLSIVQIIDRLDDRFGLLTRGSRTAMPRQQTLRATVEWSHDLCSPGERTLWARLSIFSGGFDLPAVEQVCGGDAIASEDIFELVAALVDKSLVRRDGARYRMLETIRQYGRMMLAESGEETTLGRRHRDHYQWVVMRSKEARFGPDQLRWYARLRLDHANIRAAMDFCLTEPGEAQTVFRMVTANWPYWIYYGILGEGLHWLSLALKKDSTPTAARAKALWVAGRLALLQSDLSGAELLLRDCADLAKKLGDPSAEAHAMELFGVAELFKGNYAEAISLQEEAVRRYRVIGEPPGACAVALYRMALAASASGRTDRAEAFCKESLAICENHGTHLYRPLALWALGFNEYRRGDLREAVATIGESLRLQRHSNDQWNTAQCVEVLAWIASAGGQHEHAATLLGAAHTLWRSLGTSMPRTPPFVDFHDPCDSHLHETLGDEAFAAAFQRGAILGPDEAIGYALNESPRRSRRTTRAPSALTSREQQVAGLVAQGMTNKEIAATLVIAQRTAEGHVEHILEKLGFASRAQIASWATKNSEAD